MSGLGFFHPKHEQLVAWLDGDPTVDDGVTEHIEHCKKCAARLAELADVDPDRRSSVDDELADAIREIYAPPPDLNSRVMKKIDERERADRELNLLLGLFSIGKDAAELFMPPDGDDS